MDVAVSAPGYDVCHNTDDRGAVFILMLNSDGSIKSHALLCVGEGDFYGELRGDDFFWVWFSIPSRCE